MPVRRLNSRHIIVGATAAWIFLVAVGFLVLIRYSLTPGRSGEPPATWPVGSRLSRQADRQTLVLAVHPHCPCTRASLAELAEIMAASRGRLCAQVLFVRPRGFSDPWAKTGLWSAARSIPGVVPVIDHEGVEAKRFGAFTSGQAALYDQRGRLAFGGGITGARGHVGPNLGERSILDVVHQGAPRANETSVYGCPLAGPPGREPAKEHRSCRSS